MTTTRCPEMVGTVDTVTARSLSAIRARSLPSAGAAEGVPPSRAKLLKPSTRAPWSDSGALAIFSSLPATR